MIIDTEEVLLEEVNDEEFTEAMSDEAIYPCIFISEITTEEEYNFFKGRKTNKEIAIPLYCVVEGRRIRLGDFELSLESLLSIRQIAVYSLTVYRTPADYSVIDLNDPIRLEKFIHL